MQRGMRIETGSAAGAAGQGREAGGAARGEFKATVGIRVARAGGQKFELPGRPASGAGEGLPAPSPAAGEQGSTRGQGRAAGAAPETSSAALTSRIAGVFRSLFRPRPKQG